MKNQSTHLVNVHLLHDTLVKPSKPTKQHVMFMSAFDQLLSSAPPMRTLLFYKSDKNPLDAIEALRLGIASALVQYYPMAGCLLELEDGRLVIDCNDKGVQLIQAHCDFPFAELERNSFSIRPFFEQLVPMGSREHSHHLDDPFASFQVTSFKGGLTVGIAVLHSVADGHAVWSFIQAVSEACRGEPLSVYPLHARILLKPEVFKGSTSFADEDPKHSGSNRNPYMDDTETAIREDSPPAESLQLHHTVIHFSKEMLESLKEACLSTATQKDAAAKSDSLIVSSYQALAAYLWKRLTMAQGLANNDCVDLPVLADVRNRMIPPLTTAFFGNAVVGIPTRTNARELVSESLGDTAARIGQSIQKADDAYIKGVLLAWERKEIMHIGRSHIIMMIRNASGFPVYKAGDFGWGKPEAVRPAGYLQEGKFTWYPGKQPKSVDVITSLSDATYTNFFSSQLYPHDPLQYSNPNFWSFTKNAFVGTTCDQR